MKSLLTIIVTLSLFQLRGQNWIGNRNFLDLFDKSDIVVVGTISKIQEYKNDITKISPFSLPLKSLTIINYKSFKGDFEDVNIFYKDIFNGCGYAPVLFENYKNKQTIFFLKLQNDTLFQIGSMNESPNEVAESLVYYNKIKSSTDPKEWTEWFFRSSQNSDLLFLLSNNIDFDDAPLHQVLQFVSFDINQRNWFYEKLSSTGELNYKNQGIIKFLLKYKDQKLVAIMKAFMLKLQNEPYSDVDKLMEGIVGITNKKELESILNRFNKDWRESKRKKMIKQFINKM